MASLDKKIEAYMGRTVDFLTEVTLQDDGKGAYIVEWNIKDKAKPTDDELKAKESDADKLEKNATAIDNRKAEYGTVEQQLEYITENGLTKWQENVTAIKKKYPKE
jgi:predicted Zn-dependent protease